MPTSNMKGLPGAGAMTDTLEFVRNMWGSMKIPGMVMPSISPDEINKQITDLKAVESWLQLNMNMLRGSIQALEVQSATLNALQSMGQTFSQAVNPPGFAQNKVQDKPDFDSPFSSPFTTPSPAPDSPADKEAAPAPASVLPDTAALAAQFANPAAWWNLVQDQFNQVVTQAVDQTAAIAKKPTRKSTASPGSPKASASKARKKAAPRSTAAAGRKKSSGL